MRKSTKYKKHRRSKYAFPTKVFRNGQVGTLILGHVKAKQDIEKTLGRSLHPDTKKTDTPYQWVFCEPKGAA